MCGLGMLDEDEVASIPDDTGSGKGKKEYTPDAGSQKLMDNLSDDAPSGVNSDSTDEAYRKAESELDEDFAKCNDQTIHDEIINLLNDIKYEDDSAKVDLLKEFAKNHPENEALFKTTAKDKNKQWQVDLSKDGYEQLKTWMVTLDNLFKEVQ